MSQINGKTVTTTVTLGAGGAYPNYASPLTITTTGGVSVSGTNAIQGTGTLYNQGTVTVATAGSTGAGVLLAGGSVDNAGSINGPSAGISFSNAGGLGTVLNTGRITSYSPSGLEGYGVYLGAGGTVTNMANIYGERVGVQFFAVRGTLINSGSIGGARIAGAGLQFGGYVNNMGTITSGTAANGTALSGHDGLSSGRATTVVNSGSILARSTYSVYLGPGSSFTNTQTGYLNLGVFIKGSAGTGGTVVDSGSITGTTGLDGIVVYSGSVSVASTGHVSGFRAVYIGGTGGTLINNGTLTGLVSARAAVKVHTGAITNNGMVTTALAGGVYVDAGTTLTNTANIIGHSYGVYIGGGGVDVVTNSGTITGGTSAGIVALSSATIIDSGSIGGGNGTAIQFGGTGVNLLELEQGYSLTGGVRGSGSAGATNTLELVGSVGGNLTVNYSTIGLGNIQDVLFDAGNETVKVSTSIGAVPFTVSGFVTNSETIDLTGIGAPVTYNLSGTLLTVTGTLGIVNITLDATDGAHFTLAGDGGTGTDVIACYARGTRIATETGERPVESLAIGDRVLTISGQARPIKWIGRRSYDGRFIRGKPGLLPVVVKAGALADGLPRRDLVLSPGHALYFDGVLARVEDLVNGASIVQPDEVASVEYFHLELESHDILLAEGAAAESYVDCGNRGQFQNAGEFAQLFPEDNRPPGAYCVPLLEEGQALCRLRRDLLQRIALFGFETTADPDLHLIVDGRRVDPDRVDGETHTFYLPSRPVSIRIGSRSMVPREQGINDDRRRLGVALRRITLKGAGLCLEVGYDAAALSDGYHEPEP